MNLTVFELCRYLNFEAKRYDLYIIGALVNKEFIKVFNKKPEKIKQAEHGWLYEVCIYPDDFKKSMKNVICRYFADKNKEPCKVHKQKNNKVSIS